MTGGVPAVMNVRRHGFYLPDCMERRYFQLRHSAKRLRLAVDGCARQRFLQLYDHANRQQDPRARGTRAELTAIYVRAKASMHDYEQMPQPSIEAL